MKQFNYNHFQIVNNACCKNSYGIYFQIKVIVFLACDSKTAETCVKCDFQTSEVGFNAVNITTTGIDSLLSLLL